MSGVLLVGLSFAIGLLKGRLLTWLWRFNRTGCDLFAMALLLMLHCLVVRYIPRVRHSFVPLFDSLHDCLSISEIYRHVQSTSTLQMGCRRYHLRPIR